MKNWMVLMLLAAFALLAMVGVACGDAGDAICTDCYDDESQQTVVQPPADDNVQLPPAQKPAETPTCELSLAVGKTSNLELWVCYGGSYDIQNRAVSLTLGCWEGGPCDLVDVALNPQGNECSFTVVTGFTTGVLRSNAGGWINPTDCQLLDGVSWYETQEGGYLKWPPNPESG